MVNMNNEETEVEVADGKKRDTPILGTRVTPEFLRLVDDAVRASEGKYATRTELVRDAVELYARYIKEGGLKRTRQEKPETSSKEDQEHEASVEAVVDHINDLRKEMEGEELVTFLSLKGIEDFVEDFATKIRKEGLRTSIAVWSDDRVRKAMRKALQEEVYPKGFWDGKRKFRKKIAGEWIEVLRKQLRIPNAVARELVQEPEPKYEEYQEWA